jgi:hypothetical protein
MAASDALARMWMGSPFGAGAAYPPPQYGGYTAPPPAYPTAPAPAAPEPPPDEDAAPPRRRSAPDLAADREPEPADRNGEVAAMRRELDELKGLLRESLPKKRKRR